MSHTRETSEVTINTSYFHPAHQHYTDEAQKDETVPSVVIYIFKNSLIIQEENTKKNHKRVVSLNVINFSFDFLGSEKVYFKNYFANELV